MKDSVLERVRVCRNVTTSGVTHSVVPQERLCASTQGTTCYWSAQWPWSLNLMLMSATPRFSANATVPSRTSSNTFLSCSVIITNTTFSYVHGDPVTANGMPDRVDEPDSLTPGVRGVLAEGGIAPTHDDSFGVVRTMADRDEL